MGVLTESGNDRTRRNLLPIDRPTRRGLGRAVYLLLLLLSLSDSQGQVRSGESINAEELAGNLGIGIRQARRDLQRLRHLGFVELENTGRGFKIRLLQDRSSQ